ncbi:N(4)-acetylcytidine aminohydrolase [Saccharospirillum salsuginis]|uniref:N(4)-acetylcytidine amidohydrolase n=1 Tax=Saccharospirillum salsuginis TaxID=418750 RepID=A0A918KGE7_9GAMM|nr:N(4)-acetylcytidine aminohydrolase [Saccharospirillum salsuginis]GGX62712.1 UPF0267 protein [Saccharospirillum salsuginis]
MGNSSSKITFFQWLRPLIESGQKTITIRDESESHYEPGSIVSVHTLETDEKFCDIEILSVEALRFEDINDTHARQELLSLSELKALLKDIYPGEELLYVISYRLVEEPR